MKLYRDLSELPVFRNAVVTIGTFDGVHMGHRQIISELLRVAKEVNGESVIISFHPHPRKVVSSAILGIRLINTLEEKVGLIAELGVDHLVIVPFTEAFAHQAAETYISDFLVNRFRPHTVIIGYDHRFGKDRKGDYRMLEQQASKFGYELREIPKHVIQHISISSTRIRESILSGDVTTANKLLGYSFFFEGEVVHGDKLGRELGYPTANLKPLDEEKIIPGDGIYAVTASIDDETEAFQGMMSIGFRPTVDGKKRVIEVNLFDFDRDIYGRKLKVRTIQYLREEIRFSSLPELVKQIDQDKIESLKVLRKKN